MANISAFVIVFEVECLANEQSIWPAQQNLKKAKLNILIKLTLPNLLTITFLTIGLNSGGNGQDTGEADVATDNLLC